MENEKWREILKVTDDGKIVTIKGKDSLNQLMDAQQKAYSKGKEIESVLKFSEQAQL